MTVKNGTNGNTSTNKNTQKVTSGLLFRLAEEQKNIGFTLWFKDEEQAAETAWRRAAEYYHQGWELREQGN